MLKDVQELKKWRAESNLVLSAVAGGFCDASAHASRRGSESAMSILITGGLGFLGLQTASALLRRGVV